MTLLRRPWDWDLVRSWARRATRPSAEQTAARLRRTSLLEQVELFTPSGPIRRSTIHPATAEYRRPPVRRRPGPALRRPPPRGHLLRGPGEDVAVPSRMALKPAITCSRPGSTIGLASCSARPPNGSEEHGRVREGLQLLEPFLAEPVRRSMSTDRVGRLLGTVGLAYADLGQAERAIGFYEQHLAIAREIGDRRGEGARPGQPGPRLRRPGPGGAGHRLLRAAPGHRAGDRRPPGRGATPWATWATPTPTWARWSGPSASTSSTWPSRGRSATAGARATPWATWASPTPPWARRSGPSASTSSTWPSRGRSATAGARARPGQPGHAYADLGQAERAIGFYEQHWPSRGRSATAGARATPWATWASPTPTWARRSGPSATTSSTWPSRGRSATGGARGTPWATWATPTPTWARRSGPSASTSSPGHRAGGRRPPGRGRRPGQPGHRLRRPGPGGAGHRLLRAGPGHRAGGRRPAGRGHRPGQPGQRLRRPGPGGAGHRPAGAGGADRTGDSRPADDSVRYRTARAPERGPLHGDPDVVASAPRSVVALRLTSARESEPPLL